MRARENAQLAAALNEQSGFGMHRSLLLCALRQAPERKWWKKRECVFVHARAHANVLQIPRGDRQ